MRRWIDQEIDIAILPFFSSSKRSEDPYICRAMLLRYAQHHRSNLRQRCGMLCLSGLWYSFRGHCEKGTVWSVSQNGIPLVLRSTPADGALMSSPMVVAMLTIRSLEAFLAVEDVFVCCIVQLNLSFIDEIAFPLS